MGNSNKKPQDYDVVHSFKQDQWINLEKRSNCQIWENKINHKRADVYPLNKQLKPIDLDHYEMRYNNSNDIVKVHNLAIQEDSTLCSRSSKSNILVQRIPYRLNDVAQLTHPEALSVLRSAYSGFNTLSTFYGPVEPYQDLICFNQDGKTKVWVNSNLSQNKISSQRLDNPIGSFANLNTVYVNKLFDMIENKTQGGAFPPTLKNKFRQFNPKTYFEALNLIQEYASEERIQIPPTISPRTSSNFSNGNFILQNSSSQVNPYNTVPATGQKWSQSTAQQAPLAINTSNSAQLLANTPHSQQQNTFNTSTYQSNPQSQYFNNYPLQSQSSSKLGSALPNGQFSFMIPPMRPVTNISPNLNNSFSNSSLVIKPITPQFDSPSKIVSMQTINKTVGDGNINNTLIENRTKSPIGSIANISQVKLTDRQPIDQNVLQNQNQSLLKPQSPVKSSTGQQTKYFNQPQINQAYPQPAQQFLQRPNYTAGNNQPTYLAQDPVRHIIGYSGYVQPQFSPRVISRPQIFFNNQQIVVRGAQNPVQIPHAQDQIQPEVQVQTQPQSIPQIQSQQIQIQPKIQSQGQAQAPAKVSNPSSERDPQRQRVDIKNQLIQNIQSRELSHQSGSVSQPRSQENRGELEHFNFLSNSEQNLAKAYYEQNQEDDNYGDQQDQLDDEDLYDQQQQQTDPRQQVFAEAEGEVDQVQRELERLQQQKNLDHSKEVDHDQYFPFANNKAHDLYQIKKVSTVQVQLRQETDQVHQHANNNQQNKNELVSIDVGKNKSIQQQQTQKLKRSTQNKGKRVQIQQPAIQIKQQKPASKQSSPLVVKVESSQSPGSAKIEQKRNIAESNSNQKQTVKVSNQYQYQYKSSIPQSSQNERIPQNARYEDIEQYIRNKYKTYIGVQSQSDYRPSSSVTPYQNDLGKVGEVQMASYVQSKYNQFSSSSNQEVNFSFRPSTFQPTYLNAQIYTNSNYGQRPGMINSYEYMRVQQMVGDPQQEKQAERKSSMLTDNKKSEKNGNQQDILDVKNMERSLDKKYRAMKSNQLMSIDMNKKDYNEQNQFDVKKLQENLIRFQQSRVGSGQTNQVTSSPVNQPRFQTSQVSKIQSIDEILANRRRSSMNRGLDYNKDYKDQVVTVKSYTYENQSPANQFGRRSRASKVSKQISDIDQKFNKYIKGGAINTSSSSKLISQPKPKQYNYDYRQAYQQDVSRNATGYFGDVDKGWEDRKNYQTTKFQSSKSNQTKTITGASKGPSYEDLRKFMWS